MKSTGRFAAEVAGISRRFGDQEAVSNVSFAVPAGEIYGLVGPDGAGKTTTLRMLAGALSPDEGSIQVVGLDVKEEPDRAREQLGYMPQLYGLYGDLTVTENLLFFGRLFGVESARLKIRIAELLSFVRLDEFSDRRAGNLSGGMYKKLAIACSILHEPRLLILDEPTNGVDPVSRRDLWALLFSLAEDGVTIIVSTPYMDEAERCHRVGLLLAGRLALEGEPASLLSRVDGRLFLVRCAKPAGWLHRFRQALPVGLSVSSSPEGLRVLLREKAHRRSLDHATRDLNLSQAEPVRAGIEDLLIDLERSAGGDG